MISDSRWLSVVKSGGRQENADLCLLPTPRGETLAQWGILGLFLQRRDVFSGANFAKLNMAEGK